MAAFTSFDLPPVQPSESARVLFREVVSAPRTDAAWAGFLAQAREVGEADGVGLMDDIQHYLRSPKGSPSINDRLAALLKWLATGARSERVRVRAMIVRWVEGGRHGVLTSRGDLGVILQACQESEDPFVRRQIWHLVEEEEGTEIRTPHGRSVRHVGPVDPRVVGALWQVLSTERDPETVDLLARRLRHGLATIPRSGGPRTALTAGQLAIVERLIHEMPLGSPARSAVMGVLGISRGPDADALQWATFQHDVATVPQDQRGRASFWQVARLHRDEDRPAPLGRPSYREMTGGPRPVGAEVPGSPSTVMAEAVRSLPCRGNEAALLPYWELVLTHGPTPLVPVVARRLMRTPPGSISPEVAVPLLVRRMERDSDIHEGVDWPAYPAGYADPVFRAALHRRLATRAQGWLSVVRHCPPSLLGEEGMGLGSFVLNSSAPGDLVLQILDLCRDMGIAPFSQSEMVSLCSSYRTEVRLRTLLLTGGAGEVAPRLPVPTRG